MKNKENAYFDFVEMIKKSWTYGRLTDQERERLFEALSRAHIFGTWVQRWEILNDVYFAFLTALGYKPIGWREPENTTLF
jgi:hypothetical protein